MANGDFIIEKAETEGGVTFIVKGRLDAMNSPALQLELEEAVAQGRINIAVNMTLVKYLSSTGIRVLLNTYKQVEEAGGKFSIEQPSDNVRNVLNITALDTLLLRNV